MGKGMNNIVAKTKLANTLAACAKKIEDDRWLTTEEGQLYLIKKKAKLEHELFKAQFKLGQLVWTDSVINHDSDLGKPVARCCRIVTIYDDTVEIEMLYAVFDGEKHDSYTDSLDLEWKKGDRSIRHMVQLEKHVAKKTGYIWWKG